MRRSELQRVRPCDVNFATGRIRVPAKVAKSKNEQWVSLRDDIQERLIAHLAAHGIKKTEPICPSRLVPEIRTFQKDLEWAEIPYRDEEGRVADFHAMSRNTLATNMHREGIDPRTMQQVLRHSDIKLTMQTYTDERHLDTKAAIEKLSWPLLADKLAASTCTPTDSKGLTCTRPDPNKGENAPPMIDVSRCIVNLLGMERVNGLEPSTFSLGS
ncbi:MAG: tyrosine-type recombinase/integrase [Planctomycetota bacterium]